MPGSIPNPNNMVPERQKAGEKPARQQEATSQNARAEREGGQEGQDITTGHEIENARTGVERKQNNKQYKPFFWGTLRGDSRLDPKEKMDELRMVTWF